MGALSARASEEKAELHAGKLRAARFLSRSSPSYMEDMDILGMGGAGGDEESVYSGDATETEATRSESASQAGDDARSDSGESTTVTSDDDRASKASGSKAKDSHDPRRRAKEKVQKDYKSLLENASHGGLMGIWQVRYLLRKPHVHADHKDHKGRSAMYVAAERGNNNVIEALLQTKAKVDVLSPAKWTPLHAASFHGQLKCMETLLKAHAQVNAKDMHGCTPLILAASSPKLYIVDLVSASDRRKRKKARAGAVAKQAKIDAGSSKVAKKGDITDPFSMWKFFPNRIELLALNILLKEPGVQVDLLDHMKRSPLTYAARYGRVYAVSRLLSAKANPRLSDGNGRSPLFHAAANGHMEAVEMFLRVGASPNVTDQYFSSPLHIVLQNGDDTLANQLISSEASVNAIDCEGRTPIMIAMDTGNHMMFGALVERRSNLDVLDKRGWNVVMYAVETDMLGEVLPLLTKSGDRVKGILRLYDPQGRNSLHHAAFHPNLQQGTNALMALIKLDAVAAQIGDCNGDTAVHLAAEVGRLEMLRQMGYKLGNLDFVNHRGETPLMYAAHGGHMASVIALVEDRGEGAMSDAGMSDGDGRTVLMHAVASGHLDLVNLILQNREGRHPILKFPPLDVNQQDSTGSTALHVAAQEGHWQLIPSLVLAGANKAAKDNDGCTALHACAMEDEVLSAATLLDIGLDANIGDNQGWTALMHAAWKGADDVVRLLVDAGCSLDVSNCDGDTALQICLRRKDSLMQRTKDLLTDGLLDRDFRMTKGVDARGHFMVTVGRAKDLYHEGKADQINSYVYLEFCTRQGDAPLVAYSTCVVTEASPSWYETFRFDTESVDASAYLVAWVISCPGDDFGDIILGAQQSLTEAELQAAALKRGVQGFDDRHRKPDFDKDLGRMVRRQTDRNDASDDLVVHQNNALARMPVQPPPSSYQRHDIPILERRWNEVLNFRQIMQKTGCNIQEPLIPRTHMPLGCVVARFRTLRTAVWGCEPVEITRSLRLSCKGKLSIEIDFRPTFFISIDPLKCLQSDDSFEPRTPRKEDLEETLESAALEAERVAKLSHSHDFVLTGAGGEGIRTGREAMHDNPLELFRKYKQVTAWSKAVLKERSLQEKEEQRLMLGDSAEDASWIKTKVENYQKRYHHYLDKREQAKANMDRQVTATTHVPIPTAKKAAPKAGPKAAAVPGKAQGHLPELQQSEPWMEDVLDGSRFW